MPRYEVGTRQHGRKRITRDCPAQGLLDWPTSIWTKITPRPVGLKTATDIASRQTTHAVVTIWGTAEKVYDNGKRPTVPDGYVADE